MTSDTPRTESKLLSWNLRSAELITACSKGSLGINGLNIQNRVVDAEFARELERAKNPQLFDMLCGVDWDASTDCLCNA